MSRGIHSHFHIMEKTFRNIEVDLINSSKVEQEFLKIFIAWIKQALQHTSVIVVEGNL